jgi:lysophospholipase L1-like esterase
MSSRSKLRKLAFYTIGISVSLAFSFVLLEYGAARFLLSNVDVLVDKEFDPQLGWRYKPGSYRIKPANSLIAHDIYINEYGLRDNKPPDQTDRLEIGKMRIIVVGDSFTFAESVRQEDIYTTQLENYLNDESDDSYKVVNAGVEGYGNAQQLLLIRKLAEMNVVGDFHVLQVFTNDILDNLRLDYGTKSLMPLMPGFVINGEGQLQLKYLPQNSMQDKPGSNNVSSLKIIQVTRNLIEASLQPYPDVIRFLRNLGIDAKVPRIPGVVNGWYDDDVVERGLPLMKALIREIRVEVNARHSTLLVMFIPSPFMVYPDTYRPLLEASFVNNPGMDAFLRDMDKPQRLIRQLCEELEVPFLDMYPILLRHNNETLYFPREGHLTKGGHAVVAASLAEKIQSMYANR